MNVSVVLLLFFTCSIDNQDYAFRSEDFLASLEGGLKCISGIKYSGNLKNLRSQQFAWRAAVEMSRSVAQLALQVIPLSHVFRKCPFLFKKLMIFP